jgi:hypothetical protein
MLVAGRSSEIYSHTTDMTKQEAGDVPKNIKLRIALVDA